MFFRKFLTNSNIMSKFINLKKNLIKHNQTLIKHNQTLCYEPKTIICSNCPNQLLKTKLNYALGFFTVGGLVEAYTFNLSNDFSKSTGLGWGIIPTIIIFL